MAYLTVPHQLGIVGRNMASLVTGCSRMSCPILDAMSRMMVVYGKIPVRFCQLAYGGAAHQGSI